MRILAAFAFILLAHTVLSENLKIEHLCQFMADDFTPKVFEEKNRVAANEAMKTIFSLSKQNLVNAAYGISSGVYDKIMDTIRQGSNFDSSAVYKKVQDLKILPSNTDLREFGNETNSVVFFCGTKRNSMLCEVFKVNSSDPKHAHLWKVLIYNSGNGLEYHPGYHFGPRQKYSPVVIYEGPPLLINENWIEAALDFGYYGEFINDFYPKLLSDFDRSNATYDVFIDPKRTGKCAFSSYHAYFTFKLGESAYKKIFSLASLSGLQHFASASFSHIISKSYLSKHALFLAFPSILLPFYQVIYQIVNVFPFKFVATLIVLIQNYLTEWAIRFLELIPFISKETRESMGSVSQHALASYTNALNKIGKFHFLRWNVDLVDKMFTYVAEIGNGVFGTKEHVFFEDLKVAYDQFQIFKKKNRFNAVPAHIADNRGIRASFSAPYWKPFLLGSHDKLSANDTFYCELPNFEYADGVYDRGNFTEFSNSILRFLNNEIAYQPCFMGKEIPLISYLDSLTFRVMPMLENFGAADVEKMGLLYLFFTKVLNLLDYKNDAFMYQKALILVEIFKTYKEIYTRHLKISLNNDENKFRLLNDSFFGKLSPFFSYFNHLDVLGRKLPSYVEPINFRARDSELTSKLVAILFKDNSYPLSLSQMKKFFNTNLMDYWINDDSDPDPHHTERVKHILTVILNPLDLENPNQGVLPKSCLLDRHYYNLLHMVYEISDHSVHSRVFSPTGSFYFKNYIYTKWNLYLKTDWYNNAIEIASLALKEKRPLGLMNWGHRFSSVFYFLTYLQEDSAFLLCDAGMEIIYNFILRPSTYTDDDSKKALPLATKYFLSRKEKILGEVFINGDDTELFKLLANYQIILNRLMSIQKRNLDISDLEHVFLGEYQPIFAFLKLNTLILGEKLSELPNSHNFYLSVISNFELIKSFFCKEEIQYVLRIYYDNWKFSSSKSRCAAETAKGIQNLVNGHFLIDGERIQLSELPFASHRLWKIMNVKDKRNYKVEVTLHKRRSDGSIFSIVKYNGMHLFLNQKDAFLVKDGEIEAKLVSDHFKLCHKKLGLQVAFNSKMVGSDNDVIAFQTHSNLWWTEKVYLFDLDGFQYAELSGGNTLALKNSSKFTGEIASPLPCSFHISSFCSFSSASQSFLDAFLTRGVLFNFAVDSHIFTLESEAQSFYFFDSYNGSTKDFYVMKKGSAEYFAVIKGEKFKIHPPAGIERNFFASANLPFLFVSIENSFHIIIPVPLSKPGDSYKFTFLKVTCRDPNFNIEGHDREVDLAIVYWLIFLRYYDQAMEYVSLYTSVAFQLSEIELGILRNILEIKYRDLEYSVTKTWANHLLDENGIFFERSLNEEDGVKKISDIANLIPIIPFNHKRLLFSFLPNITEDTHIWAYSNKLKIDSGIGNPAEFKANIPSLKNAIQDDEYQKSYSTPWKIKLNLLEANEHFTFFECLIFLYGLAKSSKNLADFKSRFNSEYLDFIRFNFQTNYDSPESKFASLSRVIFAVFNNFSDQKKLSIFFSELKRNIFPQEVFDIYQKYKGFKLPPSFEQLRKISQKLPSPPADYENLLNITMQRNALSSDFFKANASFTFFSDAASLEQKLKSIVSTEEFLYGFPLGALKDPRLVAQILLCGSVEELKTLFTVSSEKVPELLDLLWSHFITFFYCKSFPLQNNTFCQAWVQKKQSFSQQAGEMPGQKLPVTLHDKVFILIEFFTKYPLYEEQRTIMSTILDKMMHGGSYVVQQGMAGGKTTRFGPVAAIVATSILRKLPIFIFPNSILNQNIVQLQQWLFDFFGKRVFAFKTERSDYG
ncbi:hypothetical protein MDAP_002396 [Mitosporidium daphniae]